eukprot:CAMPEP_0206491930 /NCGR_PEP_ID=MMETSP0324_2-20121206/45554_1 /ASSEMBLY_ACC=CAM_ASM_000836 /TAXON_ID=2866 /ORGANISM="Crypthecodinium cohnii, Strain Seligo" /LENGTH=265 /DNA_ID=CAMNT_0053973745 /DNA_START=261 /DNA_END=1055 /DNA_ORIENTATION=-
MTAAGFQVARGSLTHTTNPTPAVVIALAIAIATTLQGCFVEIKRHVVGNWEAKGDYLEAFKVVPAGATQDPFLNSCSDASLSPSLQCNGHGLCMSWYSDDTDWEDSSTEDVNSNSTSPRGPKFCRCDRNWAGPECDIQRKSQMTAFLLSMSTGFLGVDQFYLGWTGWGVAKLLTFGGGGLWWIFDVVRIGSSPVATPDSYRVAADVDHWVFLLCFLSFAGVLAFAFSIWSFHREQTRKALEVLILRAEAQAPSIQHYGSMGSSPK